MHHSIVDMKQFRNTQYMVYEDGRIFNAITKRFVTPYKRLLRKNSSERHLVSLYIDGKQKHLLYYRVLAEVYIPNPENLPQVNHIDGNPLNNDLSNLEWCTATTNNIHAITTGIRPCKINQQIADEIRYKVSQGATQTSMCKEYNLGRNILSKIINNKSWIY
jgi:hypothetical protein